MSSALPPVAATLPVPLKIASKFPVAALPSKVCRLAIFNAVPSMVELPSASNMISLVLVAFVLSAMLLVPPALSMFTVS